MSPSGKCPKCEKSITHVTHSHVDVGLSYQKQWHGISYNCPYCSAVLSVGIDPVALMNDTVDKVVERLRGR